MHLTPGIRFLVFSGGKLLLKVSALGLLLHYGSRRLGHGLSGWLTGVLCATSVLLVAYTRAWWVSRKQRRMAEALGARLAPRIEGKWPGNIDVLLHFMEEEYPGEILQEYIDIYGPVINLRLVGMDLILTVSPEYVKRILSTEFNNFQKPERFLVVADSVLGTGVFNSNGDMWKFHRAMTRPFFTRDRISHFARLDVHAARTIELMRAAAREGRAVDFQDLIGRFTMDSASEMLFGVCTNSLASVGAGGDGDGRGDAFMKAAQGAMDVVGQRLDLPVVWPLWEIWADGTEAPMRVVREFIDPIIEERVGVRQRALEKGETGEEEEEEEETLLDELIKSTSDTKILRDETFNILNAGRDTTMTTLTMVIYFLSMYPEINDRLRAEVLEQVGPTRRPDFDDIRSMKYMRAVINEALRLYPPVPFNGRQNIAATVFPSPDASKKPIYIPAGTECAYSVLMMHRQKDLWGEDADEFDPDRFLDERLKTHLLGNAFQFLPFNAGPRICLGQQFAYNEVSFMLVRLLQSFTRFVLDEESFPKAARPPEGWKTGAKGGSARKRVEKFVPKLNLTLSSEGGMWVKPAEDRQGV
ncbi:Cytochrome P450 [Mycena kentingensis (nom. inval.)]|nr:Cytochrome P450 [Mycena kentingensis (nom. inval.)]